VKNQIRKVVEISINQGKLAKFKEVSSQFIERVKTSEPDTLAYEWYFNEDQSKCYVIEQYRDSDALLIHMANIRHLYEPIFEVSEITRIEVFGDPSPEVREAHLEGTKYLNYWAGISR
jgi:quinol monooxygenase YgiN